jgi:hypothetical protein
MVREFRAPDPAPHLVDFGYFHVHDPNFGLHIPDVDSFTNVAHLWDPQYIAVARAHNMRPVLDLESYLASQLESAWAANVQRVAAGISAEDRGALEAIYVAMSPTAAAGTSRSRGAPWTS